MCSTWLQITGFSTKGSSGDMTDLTPDLVAVPARPIRPDLVPLGRSVDGSLRFAPTAWQRWCKRVLDVVLGSLLALAVLPVVAAFAAVSALTLRSSPFFVQWRHGTGRRR